MSAAPTKKATASQKRPTVAKEPKVAKARPDVDASEAATSPTLRLGALVDRVTAKTGGKKKGIKEIVEATLSELGLALRNGEMLNLPDFGKVRVAKAQGAAPNSAMTLKLRPAGQAAKKKSADEALAEPADQG